MRKALALVLFVLALNATPTKVFAAGIPVVDGAALAQDSYHYAQELMNLANQLITLENQLQQAKQTYDSFTGDRGMGGLLSGQVRNYTPQKWDQAMALLDRPNGYSGLSNRMLQIMQQNSVLSSTELNSMSVQGREIVEAGRRYSATHKALGEAAYENASERFDALQWLCNFIGYAKDPKAILDLQARVTSEANNLQNESVKLQSTAGLLEAEQIALEQKKREILGRSAGSVARP